MIIHTGDFKIDYTPIDGRVMDLNRFSTLGKKGVLLLLADSTNIERQGHSLSEKTIGETLNRIFAGAKGRVIVATFASNIHRMQQIANASIRENRKIVFSGRSMENVSRVAIELGYLNIPAESLIDIDDMNRYPDENITIITTGSQGEAGAGLSRIAFGNHRKIEIVNVKAAAIFAMTSFLLPSSVLKISGSIFVWLSSAKIVDTLQITSILPNIRPNCSISTNIFQPVV